ncbi:hypothetical protein PIB30_084447 [Stylosanthes scabra]|uniref:Uncharacterized protein n=1 Tax=Stylosanthes scabra TaxID=79078 RepID=A0ABU6YSW2_9FABA|nr:hypothetical protein [Stylosanthes scabra]
MLESLRCVETMYVYKGDIAAYVHKSQFSYVWAHVSAFYSPQTCLNRSEGSYNLTEFDRLYTFSQNASAQELLHLVMAELPFFFFPFSSP